MKKKYPFDVLSEEHRCIECGRLLKKRLVEQKKTAKYCYKCWIKKKKSREL